MDIMFTEFAFQACEKDHTQVKETTKTVDITAKFAETYGDMIVAAELNVIKDSKSEISSYTIRAT